MSTLHTPLTTDDDGTIHDARGYEIADLWVIDEHGRMRVNDANEAAMRERAAEIVLRCNLHDELVEALRKSLPVLAGKTGGHAIMSIPDVISAEESAAAVIAKLPKGR